MTVSEAQVHLWRQSLDLSSLALSRLCEVLSVDEISRANQFHREVDHNRFIAARGLLRIILSRYISRDAANIAFSYSKFGKPYIASTSNASELTFNIAHSANLAVYAITRKRKIGVDLEKVQAKFGGNEIAETVFSANEIAHLRSLSSQEQDSAFFKGWTRKEAILKAMGTGLSQPLNQYEVMFDLETSPTLSDDRLDRNPLRSWWVKSIDLGDDFVAAVALIGDDWKISYWQLNGEK